MIVYAAIVKDHRQCYDSVMYQADRTHAFLMLASLPCLPRGPFFQFLLSPFPDSSRELVGHRCQLN
jgi:hypothetical protein